MPSVVDIHLVMSAITWAQTTVRPRQTVITEKINRMSNKEGGKLGILGHYIYRVSQKKRARKTTEKYGAVQ